MAQLLIKHLDSFPYGCLNRVEFYLRDGDTLTKVTETVVTLMNAYFTLIGLETVEEGFQLNTEGEALILTGESFGQDDLKSVLETVFSDVVSLPQ